MTITWLASDATPDKPAYVSPHTSTVVLTPERVSALVKALRDHPTPKLVCEVIEAVERDRAGMPLCAWKIHAEYLRTSELGGQFSEDPIIAHALQRPRGYPGDAALLDRIYFGGRDDYHHGCHVSELGRVINRVNLDSRCAQALRARRGRLAQALDEEASRRAGLRVASIACGYLREANLSRAFRRGEIARFTCVDQDSESTRQVAFCNDHQAAIIPLRTSIASLVDDSLMLEPHDFIYSAGLYDYLATPVASALTLRLFRALSPGGRLLIGNYALGMPLRGHMEAFADWWLTYREPAELLQLLTGIPGTEIESASVESCDTSCIHYLDVRKHP